MKGSTDLWEAARKFGTYPPPMWQLELARHAGRLLKIRHGKLVDAQTGEAPPELSDSTISIIESSVKSRAALMGCEDCGGLSLTSPTRKRCPLCTGGKLQRVRIV